MASPRIASRSPLTLAPAEAEALLEAGRWEEARDAYELRLSHEQSIAVFSGLGKAYWWLGDFARSITHYRRAYTMQRKQRLLAPAVWTAVMLAITYKGCLGNDAAARGWISRAETVVREGNVTALRALVWSVQAFVSMPRESIAARRLLEAAIDEARRNDDRDTELVSMADLGHSLVRQGDFEGGLRLVDEAMAGVNGGEWSRREIVVFVCCTTLAACHDASDTGRADQWMRLAQDFVEALGARFFFAECEWLYGDLLVLTGRWADAERHLRNAQRSSEGLYPWVHAETVASLADLRLRQGRIEEAAALSPGFESYAVRSVASLKLVRGDHAAARTLLEGHVRRIGAGDIGGVRALAMLVEVCLECQDLRGASAAQARLRGLASKTPGHEAGGHALLAAGRVASAHGRSGDAVRDFEAAALCFSSVPMPLEAGRARLELASALRTDDRERAVTEARAARDGFERLGAARDADRAAALLRSLGVPGKPARRGPGPLTSREREVLSLLGRGLSNPEIADRLVISRKTAAHHVSSVLAKLSLRNRAEAIAYATRSMADGQSP
jgi:DNA-binding CsgD family transcriptional regulator